MAESGRVTEVTYDYVGTVERVYPAYFAVAPDGTTTTLVGTPGMSFVEIRKAGGADLPGEGAQSQLPDVPNDGLWVKHTAAKSAKAVKG